MSTDRTAEQWLALDDLPTELAKSLTLNRKSAHRMYARKFKTDTETVWCCHKCENEWSTNQEGEPCSVPDPITIDWNTAMEWRDKVHAIRFDDAMYVIYRAASHASVWRYSDWLRRHAQPKHYLIAAAMAVERKSND